MAGTIKLDGATFLEKDGGNYKITNTELKLKSSGNTIVDSSGNAVLSESSGTITVANATLGSTVVGGVPAGAIMSFAMSSAPTGWVVCNGAVYAQGDYSELYTAIGSTWVTSWTNSESITTGDYRKNSSGVIYIATSTGTTSGTDVGDDVGVTWSTSTNFLVPDLRGEFLRGFDNGTGNDPDAATRTGGDVVGSSQDFAFQGHGHSATSGSDIDSADGRVAMGGWNVVSGPQVTTPIDLSGYGTVKFSTETRPRNKNVQYCIKY